MNSSINGNCSGFQGIMSVVRFNGCSGFLTGAGKNGLVVIQEWWGLNDQIKRMAGRFAQELNCSVFAPDLYHGQVASKEDEAKHLMDNLDWQKAIKEIGVSVQFLKSRGAKNVSVLGFCMGGALTIASCVHLDSIQSGVCFYGIPPHSLADPASIKCPLQCHFGEKDTAANFSDPAARKKLQETLARRSSSSVPFEVHAYGDAGHAFMRDGSPNYSAEASNLAFARTVEFLRNQWQQK